MYRSPDTQTAYLPLLFGGILVGMLFAACIYAKGYEGGGGLPEGMRFGVLMGLFVAFYGVVTTYATTNIGKRLTVLMAVASLVEWVIAGSVIGLVYKPASPTARREAGV